MPDQVQSGGGVFVVRTGPMWAHALDVPRWVLRWQKVPDPGTWGDEHAGDVAQPHETPKPH